MNLHEKGDPLSRVESSGGQPSILVTGVSTGIGAEIARRFLASGWRVIGTVRRAEDAEALVTEGGSAFLPRILDVTDGAALERMGTEVRGWLDGAPLDVVCSNAGTSVPAATVFQDSAAFRDAIELNLVAPHALVRVCYPLLRKPGGRVIFIGSLAGVMPLPFCAAYSAAKHGIEGLAGSLRVELAAVGISVSVVAPGSVRTAIASKITSEAMLEAASGEFEPAFMRMGRHMQEESRFAFDPTVIAALVEEVVRSPDPRHRYVKTPRHFYNWMLPRLLGPEWTMRRWLRSLGI
jgi:NAD(P)-dependent dehydrogenase (short-subunit alcohol dehydrogenase family)